METLPLSAFEGSTLRGRPGALAVCFHARWCGFCRAFLPKFEARAQDAGLPFALADLTSLGDPRWDDLAVRTVPTLVLFRDGKAVWRRDAPLGIGLFGRDIDALLAAARGEGPKGRPKAPRPSR